MEEWKECKLKDICDYGKDRIEVSTLDNSTYISTENMLPNRAGVTTATTLPTGEYTPSFEIDDTLVSNIRPYFKKIWKATFSGGCSADVLVFKAKENISKDYLYYVLADDEFFKYSMATSKGTKMPRGDKVSIMEYPIKLPPLPTQQKIAAILASLDDKIELNNKINTNLEQQAQALFKNWFVDFEPFGGKMPEGWKLGTVGDLCSTVSKTYKGNDSHVVLINTSDVEDGTILNHESVPNSKLKGQFKKTFQKDDILYSEIRPANKHYAFVDIETTSNYIASTKLMVIRPNEGINPHYLYHILTNPDLIQEMQHLAETRSGTFPQITFESELSTYQIPLLPKEEQDKLGELFEKIDNQIFHNIKENKMLSTIRDTLLPKMMNGEIAI